MTEYEFLPEAEEEMNEAALFYEDRSEGLGTDFLEEVENTIASILMFPKSGPAISMNIRRSHSTAIPLRCPLRDPW